MGREEQMAQLWRFVDEAGRTYTGLPPAPMAMVVGLQGWKQLVYPRFGVIK